MAATYKNGKIHKLLIKNKRIERCNGRCNSPAKYLAWVSISFCREVAIQLAVDNIDLINGAPIGGTVGIIDGEKNNFEKAIAWLKAKNVHVEVLKNA
ncbi:MAG TPA: hypothetical protein DCR21_03175 [Succinivibrionaceae bacterium]|nr:hypothetical protein [Succinivibrionaceae bacterium]